MSRIGPGRLPIILTVLVTAPAAAQQTAVDLQPIDQSIEDVSVLSMSLRQIEPGLRQPNDFSRVYRVHGREDLYLRQQGGLYAVFPESVYAVNKEGQLRAVIPGGTTFYIGPPPMLDPEPPPVEVPVEGLIQGRIDLRIDPHRESTVLAPTAPGRFDRSSTGQSIILGARMTLPPIVSDEEYRHRRVHGLMRRAVAGARGLPRTGAKGKRPLALEN